MSETTTGETNSRYPFQPLAFAWISPEEALSACCRFLPARVAGAASATNPVPFALIEHTIATAAPAPSGANQQPWRCPRASTVAVQEAHLG